MVYQTRLLNERAARSRGFESHYFLQMNNKKFKRIVAALEVRIDHLFERIQSNPNNLNEDKELTSLLDLLANKLEEFERVK